MKLYCLSHAARHPCFILKFKTVTLMLDCGLDYSSLLHFLPLSLVQSSRWSDLPKWKPKEYKGPYKLEGELRECAGRVFVDSVPEFNVPKITLVDLSEVDVILVSNSHAMLALPYVTEYSGFKGVVYATEPTLQAGRQFMEELVQYIDRCPKVNHASVWKQPEVIKCLPPPLKDAIQPLSWKQCYSLHDVNASLSKVHMVNFNEKLDILGALCVTPLSSGWCIGGCNWLIQSAHEKICYVAGSSTLTTFSKPVDHTALKNADLIILSQLTQTPHVNPDSMIGEFCLNAALTVKKGGNVLVPVYPAGVTYDLFECLSVHMESCGLAGVPMYFISPVADSSLAYSNIFAEWLSDSKQSKVYLPEPPFPHAELISAGRLRHYPSIHGDFSKDFKTPCVVFTGHPSLRFGDVVHFIEMWGKTSANAIIFTEPDFYYLDALAPYQPLAMKVLCCPIDTSLNFSQTNKLIKDLKPQHFVISETYTRPPPLYPHRTDLVVDPDLQVMTYKPGEVLTLPIRRKFEQINIDPELAGSLMPIEVRPGVSVAMVTGSLVTRDNQHTLKPLQTSGLKRKLETSSDRKRRSYFWGALDVQEFVDKLNKEGLTDVKVEDSAEGHIVHLPNEDTLIQLEEGSTHIICEGNEGLRVKLKDILLQCLNRL
ncbi:integrator complex subunit 9 [Lingula anatina]|uniref:Integrator complex subunit 9 n=1 Tax=Lingula anatina TaxID=7574 RepID=A0A1S3I6F7_LINAN|nr:integrator complex subunit 9 [Lingula anatina]|eukprot:XP_013393860.1 integrator complex subunit 9 [Lingula anatina]